MSTRKVEVSKVKLNIPELPEEYFFMYCEVPLMPDFFKKGWERLHGCDWCVPEHCIILFIVHRPSMDVVATRYFEVHKHINTGEGHATKVAKEHRKKGLWKYLVLKWLELLREMNIKYAIATTEKQFLLTFFDTLGFKVEDDKN